MTDTNTDQRNNAIVAICNLALSRIGVYRIDALDAATQEARQCNTLYEPLRDAVLEAHNWSFARRERALAKLDETFTGWALAYSYPDDCIAPRLIYSGLNLGAAARADRMQYEVRINATMDSNLILTDKADAILIYTARVSNPNLFSPLYIDALAYRLAADLAQSLKADGRLDQLMTEKYLLTVAQARAADANVDNRPVTGDNPYVEARS